MSAKVYGHCSIGIIACSSKGDNCACWTRNRYNLRNLRKDEEEGVCLFVLGSGSNYLCAIGLKAGNKGRGEGAVG